MKAIDHPVVLQGGRVRLEPLSDLHHPALIEAAQNEEIWRHLPLDGTDEYKLLAELRTAHLHRLNKTQYPFAVVDIATNKAIGSTRLIDIFPQHNKLEIGWTWYAPEYWGTTCNAECKYLLLRYCFETLEVNRVQLKTRAVNTRSQKAIEKTGAHLEGILRKDRVTPNGEVHDTFVYSIINDEWHRVSEQLQKLLRSW